MALANQLERELIRTDDVGLVRRLFDAATEFIDDDDERDYTYAILEEAVERWAPDAEWAYEVRRLTDETPDRERLLEEIRVARHGRDQRLAARILHREFPAAPPTSLDV